MINFLKRFFLFLILIGTISCTHADALDFTADLNRGPCATNYTRKAPGLCMRNTLNSILSTNSNLCTSTVVTELPDNVKSVLLTVEHEVISSNSVGVKQNSIQLFDSLDSTCTAQVSTILIAAYEWTATAGIQLTKSIGNLTQTIGSNKTLVSIKTTTGNTTNSYTIYIYGYTD